MKGTVNVGGKSGGGTAETAETADALTTARSIQVDLTSTSAASFDGTSDITPGVTGALPLTNGGTGKTTGPLGLYALINACSALTSSTLATGDYFALLDASASTGKKITVTNLLTYLGNNLSTGSTIAIGTYTGSVKTTDSTIQTISLGFSPSFVLVLPLSDSSVGADSLPWFPNSSDVPVWHGGYCTDSCPMYGFDSDGDSIEVLYTTSSGFAVCNGRYSGTLLAYLNYSGEVGYIYLAIE